MKTKTFVLLITLLIGFQELAMAQDLRNKIKKSVISIEDTFSEIPKERIISLDQLASTMEKKFSDGKQLNVVFIDKENLVTSQLAMVWLRTGLLYYGVDKFSIHSAGTNAERQPLTKLALLEQYGFKVANADGKQPFTYSVNYGKDNWILHSKTIQSLDLFTDQAVVIFVEKGNSPIEKTNKEEILFPSNETIARDMLYVSSRLKNHLTTEQ
ncbi:hypothetical protein [Arenibacter sp. F20364]|uniref:hypothetical protein n=1 Tax=Arenibacter sp. F20364 TaxID=2926415 RepID=UPI001FF668FF|nr:hypothetical protein [Arenibacter sp. F20364]MCK0192031.1 hypothetical protein [Arenibacter sp. F20364]